MKKIIVLIAAFVLLSPLLSNAGDVSPVAPQRPPKNMPDQVKWLADRAQISDLMLSFALAVDSRPVDGLAYQANFADGGYVQIPNPFDLSQISTIYKPDLPAFAEALNAFPATQHMIANQLIRISGDTAAARVYLRAAHTVVIPGTHWDAGGWYDCTYVRTKNGWKIFSAILTVTWSGPSIVTLGP